MSNLPPHKKLERQIERIHQLLEAEGSVITWDDHIPDPDNPNQQRQIDVTIRRDGSLTLVECRLHKDAQDVTWIEELMGRRTSLGADAVIAVSASSFTKTAKEKARHFGIILRDFAGLSREEIQNWGKKWKLAVNFCEFTRSCLPVRDGYAEARYAAELTDLDGQPLNPLTWRLLFQNIMHNLDRERWIGLPVPVQVSIGTRACQWQVAHVDYLQSQSAQDHREGRVGVRRLLCRSHQCGKPRRGRRIPTWRNGNHRKLRSEQP